MKPRKISVPNTEPEQATFDIPSAKEHLFQVVDVFDSDFEGNKFNLDNDTVIAKCEVVGGVEEGRSLLQRLNLNPEWKGFFATRLFLKSIGEEYKGEFEIDVTNWIGKQFYATVVHNKSKDGSKVYANIKEYNFDKIIEQVHIPKATTVASTEIAWDDDK